MMFEIAKKKKRFPQKLNRDDILYRIIFKLYKKCQKKKKKKVNCVSRCVYVCWKFFKL